MKIIVPMAGLGTRFARQGLTTPKPLIQVSGKPMIAWAVKSLENIDFSEIIFISQQEHENLFGVTETLKSLAGSSARIILLNGPTEGQLCTILTAQEYIDTDEDILIASADTYVVSDIQTAIQKRLQECHGIISVVKVPGDQWSFARVDESGRVVEVAETIRISDFASTGIYYFSHGNEFVNIAQEIIHNNERTKGEFYVILVYQKLIDRGMRVEVSLASEIWDMGTPENLAQFERHLRSSANAEAL